VAPQQIPGYWFQPWERFHAAKKGSVLQISGYYLTQFFTPIKNFCNPFLHIYCSRWKFSWVVLWAFLFHCREELCTREKNQCGVIWIYKQPPVLVFKLIQNQRTFSFDSLKGSESNQPPLVLVLVISQP
jgi:hypothetical protein